MMRKVLLACAVALAAGGPMKAMGGETQVRVEKGKVVAETPDGNATVEAGEKAILAPDRAPAKLVDEPIVRDMMTLYKWAKDEASKGDLKTTHFSASVLDCSDAPSVKTASISSIPNLRGESVDVWHWQQVFISSRLLLYDTDGNLLEYEKTRIGEEEGETVYSLDIKLRKPVAPDEKVELITLQEVPPGILTERILRKEGGLWKVRGGNLSPLSINYNEVVLPQSAILVSTNTPIISSFVRDGASVYVMRKYNGDYISNPDNEGEYELAFLWPDKDGTALGDARREPAAGDSGKDEGGNAPEGATAGVKTEVIVEKGKIEAETSKGTVTVGAGQKAVMKEGKAPSKLPEDILVSDAITMHGWGTDEMKRGGLRADAVVIQAVDWLDESKGKAVAVAEIKNEEAKAVDVLHTGPTGIPDNWKVYDLEGNLLKTEAQNRQKGGAGFDTYDVDIHLVKPVEAGQVISLVMVMEVSAAIGDMKLLWKEDKYWKTMAGNETKFNLNYHEVVLPASAILVGADLPVTAVMDRGGKTAVIIRNLTDEKALGRCVLTFLWPDKDGTGLGDVTQEYRKKGMTVGADAGK